ncbi:hypothetical protein FS935_10080 [Metabacillus litoralis]|uniref:YueH family protein n=1 Tax=Metabacillus litoralis TaxID=152268 RepID=A0A5C6W1S7_9BACI|nr:YueH family protein [Metabacillus litoralis]TXC91235.1 hypothetical protein FS935_10080 [Metabacillus litoralis]
MKIRKANVHSDNELITNVYIYENKQQEYSMIAIPQLEWSTLIPYEEDRRVLKDRLCNSLLKKIEKSPAVELMNKIVQWVGEM